MVCAKKITLRTFLDELCKVRKIKMFSVQKWDTIQKITQLLKVFKEETTLLSSVYYPKSHLVLNQNF